MVQNKRWHRKDYGGYRVPRNNNKVSIHQEDVIILKLMHSLKEPSYL